MQQLTTRAVIYSLNTKHLLLALMLSLNLSVVDTIYLQSNNFVMDMKIKRTGESELKKHTFDNFFF